MGITGVPRVKKLQRVFVGPHSIVQNVFPPINTASLTGRDRRSSGTQNNGQLLIKLVHMLLASKILKTVGTQSYPVFSLHRPEEMSMRSRPIIIGAW